MKEDLIINGIDFDKRLEEAKLLVHKHVSESYNRDIFWRAWYDLGVVLHTKEHYEYYRLTFLRTSEHKYR